MDDNPIPDEETVRLKQMEITHAEDQWRARWDFAKPPPKNGLPDLRPLVRMMDETLIAASRYLEIGTYLSPLTVQRVKNALISYQAANALMSGEMDAETFDALAEYLYGDEAREGQG